MKYKAVVLFFVICPKLKSGLLKHIFPSTTDQVNGPLFETIAKCPYVATLKCYYDILF